MVVLALFLAAGSVSCGSCHRNIQDSYRETAHFHTSAAASAASIRGNFSEGRNVLRTSTEGVYFRMERRGDAFYQTAFDHGKSRTERFGIVIGSGRRGQSYLYWKGRLLYELPVSFFASSSEWINSPGYTDGEINFDRVIPPRCLACHSTEGAREGQFFAGIACRKCHGPADEHPGVSNPAKWGREEKVAVCASCHSGVDGNAAADVHGNQVGLLRRSRCFQQSPEMSCSTCHNVHRVERDLAALSAHCLECHSARQCNRAAAADNCIDCHMPLQPSGSITFRTVRAQTAQFYRTHTIGIYRSSRVVE